MRTFAKFPCVTYEEYHIEFKGHPVSCRTRALSRYSHSEASVYPMFLSYWSLIQNFTLPKIDKPIVKAKLNTRE